VPDWLPDFNSTPRAHNSGVTWERVCYLGGACERFSLLYVKGQNCCNYAGITRYLQTNFRFLCKPGAGDLSPLPSLMCIFVAHLAYFGGGGVRTPAVCKYWKQV